MSDRLARLVAAMRDDVSPSRASPLFDWALFGVVTAAVMVLSVFLLTRL